MVLVCLNAYDCRSYKPTILVHSLLDSMNKKKNSRLKNASRKKNNLGKNPCFPRCNLLVNGDVKAAKTITLQVLGEDTMG